MNEDEAEQVKLTALGGFLRLIISVSEISPLIWSIFFAVAFLIMQYASFTPATFDERAAKR